MARLVWLLLLMLAVIALLRGWRRREGPTGSAAGSPPAQGGGPPLMLRCAHCGMHLTRDDAVLAGDRVYCSEAHHLADATGRPTSSGERDGRAGGS